MSKYINRFNKDDLADNPRATLAAWQFYEQLVVAAFLKRPEAFYGPPTYRGLSGDTVVSRVRDAIRGKIAFDYPSCISTHDLSDWFSKVVFIATRKHIFIGSRDQRKAPAPDVITETKKDGSYFETLDSDSIDCFARLISRGHLSSPILPIVIRNPPSQVAYPDYPNLQIFPQPDGSLVLL